MFLETTVTMACQHIDYNQTTASGLNHSAEVTKPDERFKNTQQSPLILLIRYGRKENTITTTIMIIIMKYHRAERERGFKNRLL